MTNTAPNVLKHTASSGIEYTLRHNPAASAVGAKLTGPFFIVDVNGYHARVYENSTWVNVKGLPIYEIVNWISPIGCNAIGMRACTLRVLPNDPEPEPARDWEKEFASEELKHQQTIHERDAASDAFDKAAEMLGVETEYSNRRGYPEILADMERAIRNLKSPLDAPQPAHKPTAEPEPEPVKIKEGYWYRTDYGNPILSLKDQWFLDYSTESSFGRPFEYLGSIPLTPWYAHEPLPEGIPEWIKNAAKLHPTPPVKVEVGGVYASKTGKQYRCIYEAKGVQTYPYVCIARDGTVLKTASNSAVRYGTELRFVRRVPESEIEAGL